MFGHLDQERLEALAATVATGTIGDADAFGDWIYTIDWLGRATKTQWPLEAGAGSRALSATVYNADGTVASETSESGDVTTYTYDAERNVIESVVDHATSGVPDTVSVSDGFDEDGLAAEETEVWSAPG